MIFRYLALCALLVSAALPAIAQTNKEDKQEQQAERKAANQDKVDVSLFRRQILASGEYSAERRRASTLPKSSNGPLKIVAYVDSTDTDDASKLTGYIQRVTGDNTVNVYELTFNRVSKKIARIKLTGEADDSEPEEIADTKKAAPKQAAKPKKKSDDEDEEDEPEEKPSSKKQKKDKDEDD